MTITNRFIKAVMTILATTFMWLNVSHADTIAIIGTGDVGSALGSEFAQLNHTIVYGSRHPEQSDVAALVAKTGKGASAKSPQEAAALADIVVLAVPGSVAVDVVKGMGDLSNKIILDLTNLFKKNEDGTFGHLLPGKESNAALIQAVAPNARVVKAFNTLNWRFMVDPASSGGRVTLPISGNDVDAKNAIAALAHGMGLETMDIGPLQYARIQEDMAVLLIYAGSQGRPFNVYLQPTPQPANK